MDVIGGQGRGDLLDHDLGGTGLIVGLGLHNTGTDGGHLGTETGADDGGHQVTAEGRTGHLQVGVLLELGVVHIDVGGGAQEVLVLLHIHVQMGAVGGQAGVQTGSAAGPRSRPRLVAPISMISGFFSMMRSHSALA